MLTDTWGAAQHPTLAETGILPPSDNHACNPGKYIAHASRNMHEEPNPSPEWSAGAPNKPIRVRQPPRAQMSSAIQLGGSARCSRRGLITQRGVECPISSLSLL